MSRLSVLEHGHTLEIKEEIDRVRAEGGYVSDVGLMLKYRERLFGKPFSEALQVVMRGPSDWTVAERELFAAFVSAQNQCPF